MEKIIAEYDKLATNIEDSPKKIVKFGPLSKSDNPTQIEKMVITQFFGLAEKKEEK